MCTHDHKVIVVLFAFDVVEQIGIKCTECEQILEVKNQ